MSRTVYLRTLHAAGVAAAGFHVFDPVSPGAIGLVQNLVTLTSVPLPVPPGEPGAGVLAVTLPDEALAGHELTADENAQHREWLLDVGTLNKIATYRALTQAEILEAQLVGDA